MTLNLVAAPHATLIPEWTLGDRMRKAREAAGIGTSEMADYIGMNRNTMGNYESGRTRPRLYLLREWSRVTGVPMWWLQGESAPAQKPADYHLGSVA